MHEGALVVELPVEQGIPLRVEMVIAVPRP